MWVVPREAPGARWARWPGPSTGRARPGSPGGADRRPRRRPPGRRRSRVAGGEGAAVGAGQGGGRQRPAEGWRRVGEDASALPGHLQRGALDDVVGGQVLGGEQAVVGGERQQRIGEGAAGEAQVVAAPQGREERRQIRVAERVAGDEELALRGEEGPPGVGPQQDRLEEGHDAGLTGEQGHPLGGQAGGGGDHGGQVEPAQPAVHVPVPGEAAGDRDRARSAVEGLAGGLEGDLHLVEHGRGCAGPTPTGRVDEEVEQHLLALGRAGQAEPPAGQAGQARFGHRRREPGGHHRVEGVAAGGEHLGGRPCGGRVPGGDQGAGGTGWRRGAHRRFLPPPPASLGPVPFLLPIPALGAGSRSEDLWARVELVTTWRWATARGTSVVSTKGVLGSGLTGGGPPRDPVGDLDAQWVGADVGVDVAAVGGGARGAGVGSAGAGAGDRGLPSPGVQTATAGVAVTSAQMPGSSARAEAATHSSGSIQNQVLSPVTWSTPSGEVWGRGMVRVTWSRASWATSPRRAGPVPRRRRRWAWAGRGRGSGPGRSRRRSAARRWWAGAGPTGSGWAARRGRDARGCWAAAPAPASPPRPPPTPWGSVRLGHRPHRRVLMCQERGPPERVPPSGPSSCLFACGAVLPFADLSMAVNRQPSECHCAESW